MDVSLSSLRRALASRAGIAVPPAASLPIPEVYRDISELHKAELAEFESEFVLFGEGDRNRVLFFYVGRKGHLRVHFYVEDSVTSDRDIVTKTVKRLFSKPRDVIQAMHYEDENSEGYAAWAFDVICDPMGRTVGSVWQAYQALCFILTTFPKHLAASVDTVQLALRLGRPDALLGAAESSWLEVKSGDYYRLASTAEKIKLALDVARIANADGGLIILGMRTSRSNGLDIITQVNPLPMPLRSVASYRSTIDKHLYPLIRGLNVVSVPTKKAN